jgi:hypothetical protein
MTFKLSEVTAWRAVLCDGCGTIRESLGEPPAGFYSAACIVCGVAPKPPTLGGVYATDLPPEKLPG